MQPEKTNQQNTLDYTAVITTIRDMVLAGKLKLGDRLPAERKLCEQLGVSRSTLRRALQALAERNIVESRQGAGTYLIVDKKGFTAVDSVADVIHNQQGVLHHILEFRQLIEPQIAALAARRITQKELERLENIINEQEKSLQDGEDTVLSDVAFHQVLIDITGNPVISQVMETIAAVIDTTRSSNLQNEIRTRSSISGHRRVLEALRTGDRTLAFEAMESHIKDIKIHIE